MLKISEKAIQELGKIPHLMLLVGVAIESGRVVLDQVAESALNEMGSKRRIFTSSAPSIKTFLKIKRIQNSIFTPTITFKIYDSQDV